jgi:hypothetical protein
MILLEDKIISEEIFSTDFICHLEKCKGACCIEGDSGAPLDSDEVLKIQEMLEQILPYMEPLQKELLQKTGFHENDEDGDIVTTCLPSGECVFTKRNEQGILECGIENAFLSGKSNFRKPISCHLYPIRLSKVGNYTAINYHKWDICNAACQLGQENQMPLFRFLKDALIRAFGSDFYQSLEEVYEEWHSARETI